MNRDANTPKKAERPICKWLNLIGVKDVRHVGNEGHGPPDFIGRYHGKVVAVESVLLPTKPKKAVTRNERIKELVREMVEDPDAEDHIHQVCFEYDCELPEKHLRFDAWRDGAIKALRYGMSGEWYQILPEGKRMGTRGIKIGIVSGGIPTKNLVVSVQENMGERIDAKAMTDSIQNVVSIVREKSGKVQRGERASHYDTWWLIIDGDLLMERGHLSPEETEKISSAVSNLKESRQWSKIIVMSRMTGDRSWPLWESDEQPRLPSTP